MVYGELYIPQVAQGLVLRAGRYISLPDIEAQLAPNNYMYTHSFTYNFDNYTNTGVVGTVALTKQLFVQLGVEDGTETPLWHGSSNRITNLVPYNPLYPNANFAKDPGNQPSFTACVRYSWDDEHNNLQPCANGINRGNWGYNNLQWYGSTFYHKSNDHWHLSFETYYEYQDGVPNANNPQAQAIVQAGGTPFSPQFIPFNAPNLVQCKNATVLRCRASATAVLDYLNYSPDPLNNVSLRTEFYADPQGQRTGTSADIGRSPWVGSIGCRRRSSSGPKSAMGSQPCCLQRQPDPRRRAGQEPHVRGLVGRDRPFLANQRATAGPVSHYDMAFRQRPLY